MTEGQRAELHDDLEGIGDRLREERTKAGLSQRELARRLGLSASMISPLVHPEDRQSIDLASGVRWEELTATSEDGVDFLHATYEVGGASTPDESLMRHHGREYGYVISGTLGIQIGFQEYELSPGDSIAFDSTSPHRLFNKSDEPVHAIWFVVGRDTDGRANPG